MMEQSCSVYQCTGEKTPSQVTCGSAYLAMAVIMRQYHKKQDIYISNL